MAAGNVQIIYADSDADSETETDESTGARTSSSSATPTTTENSGADLSSGSAAAVMTATTTAPSSRVTTVHDSGDFGVNVKRATVGSVRFGKDVGENRHYWFGDSDDDESEDSIGGDDAREHEARDAAKAACSACDDVAYNDGELTRCFHCREDHSTICCETLGYDEGAHSSLPREAAPLIRYLMQQAAGEARLEMAHALAEARATHSIESDDEQSINLGPGWKMVIDDSSLNGQAKGKARAGLALMEQHKAEGHPGVGEFSDSEDSTDDDGDDREEFIDGDEDDVVDGTSDDDDPLPPPSRQKKTASALHSKMRRLNHNVQRDVRQLRRLAYVLGGGDADRTALIYAASTDDKSMSKARRVGNLRGNVDSIAMDAFAEFMSSDQCRSGGTRPQFVEQAIQNGLFGLTPPDAKERRLIDALAVRTRSTKQQIRKAARGRKAGKLSKYSRATRYDKRDLGWITDLSHSPEIARLNTFSRKRKRVTYPDLHTEEHDEHTLCVTRSQAVDIILASQEYKDWQETHKRRKTDEPLTISRTLVYSALCRCLKDPHWRECADELYTALREFVAGWERIRQCARREQLLCGCAACCARRHAEVSVIVHRTQRNHSSTPPPLVPPRPPPPPPRRC